MAQITECRPYKMYLQTQRAINQKEENFTSWVRGFPTWLTALSQYETCTQRIIITSCNTIPKQKRRKHRNLKQEKKQPCLAKKVGSYETKQETFCLP